MTAPANPFATAPTPAPVVIPPTQNPTVVDPGAAEQAAAFAAWQAEQARIAAAAAAAAAAAQPAAPAVDPAYAAWQAEQARLAAAAAQPAAPASPAPTMGGDPFDDPAPQRPRGARLPDMYGRLLLVIPKHVERVASNDPEKPAGTMVDRMTADVIVLDGGPLNYGGKPEEIPPIPHDKVAQIPFRQQDMFLSAVGIISQCRTALDKRKAGQPGMVIGRLGVGTQSDPRKKKPYLLEKVTDADRTVARAYLATIDPFA